jgi:enamine deaminase RidA (YjgF/YER057c/UK114 family)
MPSRPVAINPEELGAPSGYSHGMLGPSGGRMLFVAGQIGWDAEHRLVGQGLVEQFEQALDNVMAVVRAAGGEPANVARMTVYVLDREEYAERRSELGAAYRRVMGRHFPAMALLEVSGLLEPGARVEVEATAVLPPVANE